MTADLDIRGGTAVEVDTDSLRAAASVLGSIAGELRELEASATRVVELAASAAAAGFAASLEATLLRSSLERARQLTEQTVDALGRAAAHYEAVELLVARGLAERSGGRSRLALDVQLVGLLAHDPRSLWAATRSLARSWGHHRDLDDQMYRGARGLDLVAPGWLPSMFFRGVDLWGRGAVPVGARLGGTADPVVVAPEPSVAIAPPKNLAEAAARIPRGEHRIRVERYDMPGSAPQYALYVAGTSWGGERETFDMRSNMQLYTGQRSASSAAVTAALRDAGVGPGDVVHAFAHSQGAMAVERLALEREFATVVSFGSPIHAHLGEKTLSVSVRHTDDPVAALQSRGHPVPVGAPGSFVVERLADPATGLHDLAMPGHVMTSYAETSALIDSSSDPRVDALRAVFEGLDAAGLGSGADYTAVRVSPSADSAAG